MIVRASEHDSVQHIQTIVLVPECQCRTLVRTHDNPIVRPWMSHGRTNVHSHQRTHVAPLILMLLLPSSPPPSPTYYTTLTPVRLSECSKNRGPDPRFGASILRRYSKNFKNCFSNHKRPKLKSNKQIHKSKSPKK
jgi:hypothetical protein